MKNIFFIALTIIFAGCSSDDDKSETIEYDQLPKKWYFASETVNGETEIYDDHEACGKDYIEFVPDGTFYFVDIFACDGNDPLADTSEAVWVREGNEITITSVGQETFTIRRLTSSNFEIEVNYDQNGDGVEETVIQKFTNN